MDALKDFENRSLDFVYIDANHDVQHVMEDIAGWINKVKKGGILAGHDFEPPKNARSHGHVTFAVPAFAEAWHINPWFILGSDTRLPGEIRDSARTWFWIV